MKTIPIFTNSEKDLMEFLFNHRIFAENEAKEFEIVNYLKSIQSNFLEMFDAANSYHSDDRLSIRERKIIKSICRKLNQSS